MENNDDDTREEMGGPAAARALADMDRVRGAFSGRARWSIARHAAVGLMLGAMIVGYALPGAWPVLVVVLSLVAMMLVIARDRRRDGFFVNGYRPGRTRWVSLTLVVMAWVALAAAIVLKGRYGMVWAPIVIGAAVIPFGTVGSMVWERVYRRELQEASVER